MRLTKFEQSGFILETDSGYRLAIDIGAYTPLERLTGITAEAMIVSHMHSDHLSLPQIKKLSPQKLYLNQECIEAIDKESLTSEITRIKTGDKIDINGIKIQFFDVDHGPNVKLRPRENFGFLIEADGQTIYFAGDMFYPSGIDVSDLVVDFALIPVGTFYTFGPQEALNFIKKFKQVGTVIPMHYEKGPQNNEEFIKLAIPAGFKTE